MPKETRKKKHGQFNLTVTFDKASPGPIEVMIYQDIGDDPFSDAEGFTAEDFVDATKDLDRNSPIHFRLNSAGGTVWDGLAIKTLVDEWPGAKSASIDGMAASVASWMLCSKDITMSAPRHAQLFVHNAWGLCMGNANDMRKKADDLEKTTGQIAEIYSAKSGLPVQKWIDLMTASSLLTAEEANKLGLVDTITDQAPVSNFSAIQVANIRSNMATLNSLRTLTTTNSYNMNRKQKIAMLNKFGVSVSKNAADSFLDLMLKGIKESLPQNSAKFKNGKDGDHADNCDCADCAMKNAPEPKGEPPGADDDDDDDHPGSEGELWKAATANKLKQLEKQLESHQRNSLLAARSMTLQSSLDKLVTEGRLPAKDVANWLKVAMEMPDNSDGTNAAILNLGKMPVVLPGHEPMNIDFVGDEEISPTTINKYVLGICAMQESGARNAFTLREREEVGLRAKRISVALNKLKTYNAKTGELEGPVRAMWDSWAASPRNANVMSPQLLRQVIMSEVMRAFRRQFTSLTYFAHNFGNVPLQGTDKMEVPYYPLDTVASSEFNYATGYVIAPNAQTLYKEIQVGGIGNGVATPGVGRKYKGLQFTAYEIRRQPWLDIAKLSAMAGEQLAIDTRADIIGTNINAANFGNAIWTGNAGGFDHTVVGGVLMVAATNAFWPFAGRNVVVNPLYHANLAIDQAFAAYLYSGSTDTLNTGVINNKYSFEHILADPLLPVLNTIRGGDGAAIAGTDPNLAGYVCWPSAIGIATAPIMPPPGVLKKLVAYDQITDDQTGLSFTYQFFGDETRNRDNEIIECSYGSAPLELKALFRLTSQGN